MLIIENIGIFLDDEYKRTKIVDKSKMITIPKNLTFGRIIFLNCNSMAEYVTLYAHYGRICRGS